jgi:hypothetical protein
MSAHVNDHGVATTTVTHHGSDMRAAFMGLIVGAIAILIVVVAIVMLTNRSHAANHAAPAGASHEPAAAAPATGTPAAGAPAAGTPATPPPTTPH